MAQSRVATLSLDAASVCPTGRQSGGRRTSALQGKTPRHGTCDPIILPSHLDPRPSAPIRAHPRLILHCILSRSHGSHAEDFRNSEGGVGVQLRRKLRDRPRGAKRRASFAFFAGQFLFLTLHPPTPSLPSPPVPARYASGLVASLGTRDHLRAFPHPGRSRRSRRAALSKKL